MNPVTDNHLPTTAAYGSSVTTPFTQIASELQQALGQRLVAYAAKVGSPKNVGRWAAGTSDARQEAELQVRSLYRAVRILRDDAELSDEGIRAWLLSANPELDDQTPIERLRDGGSVRVCHAAASFVSLIA